MGAQNRGLQDKSLFCEESKNRTFCFPWSKKAMDGLFTRTSKLMGCTLPQVGLDYLKPPV